MIRSFKLKIVFSSALLSGALLAVFGWYCIRTTRRVGIERIDRELRALVDTDLRKSQPATHWPRMEGSLKALFGDDAERTFILKVADAENRPLFESAGWEQLQSAVLPLPPPVGKAAAGKVDTRRERPFNMRQENRKPAAPPLPVSEPEYASAGNWRVMSIRNPEVILQLGISLDPFNAEIAGFRRDLLLAVPVALLLLVGIGWLLSRLALRPVNTIARTAGKVTALHLDERIPVERADREFRQLVDIINQMLTRLEASFGQAVRFSADAAHELKTPLTILQGQIEAALQSAPDGSPDQRRYRELLDEVLRLNSITRKLLLLARADAGQLPLHIATINFSAMIAELADDIRSLLPEVEVRTRLQPDIALQGDAELIGQVIQNLASNAVKYCGGESPITLALTGGDRIVFTIANRGQPVPPEERERIFDRFYRTDRSRSRRIDGSGLGLSLAREIARAHGGTLELMEDTPGETVFRLALPPTDYRTVKQSRSINPGFLR